MLNIDEATSPVLNALAEIESNSLQAIEIWVNIEINAFQFIKNHHYIILAHYKKKEE